MSETTTVADLKSMIRDELRSGLASVAVEAVEKADDAAKRATADGAPLAAIAKLAQQEAAKRRVDPANDALKGRGLAFTRAVKAMYVAKADSRDVESVVKGWVAQGHQQYADTVEDVRAVRMVNERALSEGNFTAGGALVPASVGEFIELLYPATLAYALGANDLEFNRTIDLGRLNSGATTYYISEGSPITVSQPATGKIGLSAKKLGALVPMSNELLRNPSVTADMLVRNDLLQQIALRRDLSFFRGAGANGEPKGITNWITSANKNASAGTTLANKVADLIQAIRLVDESNVPLLSAGFAFSPRTKWSLASTLDSQGKFVFAEMLASGNLFGFKFGTTTQIPNNLSGSNSEVYFGAFNDAILGRDIGTQLAVEMFPNGTYFDGSAIQSGISNDQSVIRAIEAHDVALRHTNTFSMITGVAWT